MLTVGQVAKQLQVCLKTIRRWTMAKELHVHRLGSRRLRTAEDDFWPSSISAAADAHWCPIILCRQQHSHASRLLGSTGAITL